MLKGGGVGGDSSPSGSRMLLMIGSDMASISMSASSNAKNQSAETCTPSTSTEHIKSSAAASFLKAAS